MSVDVDPYPRRTLKLDEQWGTVTADQFPRADARGWVHSVAIVDSDHPYAPRPAWIEWHPADESSEKLAERALLVPGELRPGHVIEWTVREPDTTGNSITYYVVLSISARELVLIEIGGGPFGLQDAFTYRHDQGWGPQQFSQVGLTAAFNEAMATATGRGARALDVLLRAISGYEGDDARTAVTRIAMGYATQQRPR